MDAAHPPKPNTLEHVPHQICVRAPWAAYGTRTTTIVTITREGRMEYTECTLNPADMTWSQASFVVES